MNDFTLESLRSLFETLSANNFAVVRFDNYWRDVKKWDAKEKVALLRHDVDRFPTTALATAKLEAELGITGTYFFRVKPWTFKSALIEQIAALGHEIGYHYEVLADARGDFGKAFELFESNLAALRKIAPVVSAAMHSRPLSRWDGRLIWREWNLESFGLIGEVYQSIDHSRYMYVADSGRNWSGGRNVVWDSVEGVQAPNISGTKELCAIIDSGQAKKIHLLIHPNRWRADFSGWHFEYLSDKGINLAKTAIKWIHGTRQVGKAA